MPENMPSLTRALVAITTVTFGVLLLALAALRCNPPRSAVEQEQCRVAADAAHYKRALAICPKGEPLAACPEHDALEAQYTKELEACR
jgi:hypothetical protein